MKLIRWNSNIINIEGLRNIEYSSTNYKARLYFQNESRVVEIWVNEKELEEFYLRINKANENNS